MGDGCGYAMGGGPSGVWNQYGEASGVPWGMDARIWEEAAKRSLEPRWGAGNMAKARGGGWKSVKIFMVFHTFSRFITKISPVITRFYAFLRVGAFLKTARGERLKKVCKMRRGGRISARKHTIPIYLTN